MSKKSYTLAWPSIDLPHGLMADARLAPHVLVRTAAFSTLDYSGAARRPTFTEPTILATMAPFHVAQTAGSRLSQSDAEIFFWLLGRAYRHGAPVGNADVYFKRAEALEAMGRRRGGKSDRLIGESLHRLSSARFNCNSIGIGSQNDVQLLSSVIRHSSLEKPYDYKVTLPRSAAALLDANEWVVMQADVRIELVDDPLALSLHAFYSSHRSAYPMLPGTLKMLMGRESMQESKWRHALCKALMRVQSVTGWWQCELVKEGMYAGKVEVKKGTGHRRPTPKRPRLRRRPSIG